MKKYNALIIGAGSIGAMKPDSYDSPKTKEVLTIAHAMYNNKRIAFDVIDTDLEKEQKAREKWGIKQNSLFEKANPEEAFDIVAVCTPTDTHYQTLKNVIKHIKPKLIIAEKPFCANKKQAAEIVRLCKKNNIYLVIDYIRRYDSSTYIIQNELSKCSSIYWATVSYNRGFIHEACHGIDLMNFWFGKCKKISLPVRREIVDRSKNDPAAYIVCEHVECPVFYMPVDGREFSIFEITIMTNRGKFVLTDHGKTLHSYGRIKEPTYGNYDTINPQPLKLRTELTTALSNMIGHCVAILDTGDFPIWICSGDSALAVHDVINLYNKTRRK